MSHHRVAAGYLRTGNIDLATLEIEGLREAWGKVSTLPRPAAFRDQERYTAVMLDVAARLIGTTLVLNLGRVDVAREFARRDPPLGFGAAARRTASRCWPTACSTRICRWMRCSPTTREPDWEQRARRGSRVLPGTLQRCDGMAPPAIRNHAEFRRLIDGALASLAQMSQGDRDPRRRPAAPPADRIALVR